MARPKKIGLSYFSLNTDFFLNKKIKRTIACVGAKGITVYLFLLCEIYRYGYWISCDEDLLLDIADSVRISRSLTMEILNCLISRGLFDKQLADSEKVLTSEEIQRRYFTAKKAARSTVEIEGRYWLLKSEETDTSFKVHPDDGFCGENHSYYGKNSDNYRKNNTKESKVKESKVYYLSRSESEQKESEFSIPAFDEVLTFAEEQQLDINAYKFYEYYHKHDWKTKNGDVIKDWKKTMLYWAQQERKGNPAKVKKEIESDMAEAYKSLVYNIKE